MSSRHIALPWKWHEPSEQPYAYSKRPWRWQLLSASLGEYLATAATVAWKAPVFAGAYLRLGRGAGSMAPPASASQPADFAGVAVGLESAPASAQLDLLDQLGAKQVLLRVPVWHRDQLDRYQRFAADLCQRLPGRQVVISIPQDRASVCNLDRWERDLAAIFSAFAGLAFTAVVGQAVNRRKWGCAHLGDYFDLAERAERLRKRFPRLRLLGAPTIDFEPLATARALHHQRRFHLDGAAALLYVDRRGSPRSTQYGYFDLARKIRCIAAIVQTSRSCAKRLWITEVNWPLAGTGQAAPASTEAQVGEDAAAQYLTEYYRIAWQTGMVERVYWWQLVAAGYGLVDPRDGKLRPRPAFDRLARILRGADRLDATAGQPA